MAVATDDCGRCGERCGTKVASEAGDGGHHGTGEGGEFSDRRQGTQRLLEPQRGGRNVQFPIVKATPDHSRSTVSAEQASAGGSKTMPIFEQQTSDGASAEAHNGNGPVGGGGCRSTIALWLGHASVVSTEPYTVLATAMARGTGRCATTLRWR